MIHSRKSEKSQRLPLVSSNNDNDKDKDQSVLRKSERMVAVERYKINATLILIIVLFTSNCLLFSKSNRDCNQQFQPLSMVQNSKPVQIHNVTNTLSMVQNSKPVQMHNVTNNEIEWVLPPDLAGSRNDECAGATKISKTGGFCLTKTKVTGGNNLYDEHMANFFAVSIFKGDSVVDLGAGLGHYGKMLMNHKSYPVTSWAGYDGAINVKSATDGLVKFMDLTQPGPEDERPCAAKADWVLSLEVAEHIPPEHTDSFLRNIRCRASKGAVISWALPDQTGGLGHVNMKTEGQMIELVERWGFRVDWTLTKGARDAATLRHFKASVVVYRLI